MEASSIGLPVRSKDLSRSVPFVYHSHQFIRFPLTPSSVLCAPRRTGGLTPGTRGLPRSFDLASVACTSFSSPPRSTPPQALVAYLNHGICFPRALPFSWILFFYEPEVTPSPSVSRFPRFPPLWSPRNFSPSFDIAAFFFRFHDPLLPFTGCI